MVLNADGGEVNVQLLEKVLKNIEYEQVEWYQGDWGRVPVDAGIEKYVDGFNDRFAVLNVDCGTAACFAGWTVLESGGKFVIDEWSLNETTKNGFNKLSVSMCVNQAGDLQSIAQEAAKLLGLDEFTTSHLFDGDNDLDDLKEMVGYIIENGSLKGFDEHDDDCSDNEDDDE